MEKILSFLGEHPLNAYETGTGAEIRLSSNDEFIYDNGEQEIVIPECIFFEIVQLGLIIGEKIDEAKRS
jgi:hypothetical protein